MGVIYLHLGAAALAAILGGFVLWARKGTPLHKANGRVWILLMAMTAMVSFEIKVLEEGRYSWIHLLSAWTLISLLAGLWAVRTGRIRTHKGFMIGTYLGALIAGLFALMPGRFLGAALF